ncbi:hypothetical protein D3C78_1493950 [compost metagenome]
MLAVSPVFQMLGTLFVPLARRVIQSLIWYLPGNLSVIYAQWVVLNLYHLPVIILYKRILFIGSLVIIM